VTSGGPGPGPRVCLRPHCRHGSAVRSRTGDLGNMDGKAEPSQHCLPRQSLGTRAARRLRPVGRTGRISRLSVDIAASNHAAGTPPVPSASLEIRGAGLQLQKVSAHGVCL
jgi:hypothetical protein